MMLVCCVAVETGKAYAWTECHEGKPFLFKIEGVLDGQGVHSYFGDLVGWGR